MIQPLDDYFDDYASDALKSYVESGGDELMDCITNDDGEIMAIPAPNLTAGGVKEMWIRQDWLDALGLEAPRTWDELAQVANAFVTEDPDGNGEDDTIGILGPGNADHMNAVGGNQFGLDPLFSCYRSYPQYWLEEDGKVEYGSNSARQRLHWTISQNFMLMEISILRCSSEATARNLFLPEKLESFER